MDGCAFRGSKMVNFVSIIRGKTNASYMYFQITEISRLYWFTAIPNHCKKKNNFKKQNKNK